VLSPFARGPSATALSPVRLGEGDAREALANLTGARKIPEKKKIPEKRKLSEKVQEHLK
jgi:hypothetical protein